MSVLILGGSGFLGSAAALSLSARNHKVKVICRNEPPAGLFGAAPVELHLAELATLTAADRVFDGVDTILHFVSTTTPASSMNDMAFDVSSNLFPLLNLMKIMAARRIPRLIFSSSGGTIYGTPSRLPASETDRADPISSYGITKLAMEKFIGLHAHNHQLRGIILRIGNPYGPYQMTGTAIGSIANFMALHARYQPIQIWGDGSVTRDYIFIDDVSNAVAQIVADTDFPADTYNLASGRGFSLLDIICEIERVSGRKAATSFLRGREMDVPAIVLDITKLRKALPRWEPRLSLADGIALMWDQATASTPGPAARPIVEGS
jgi:UDP-glucose 4-epimerase